MHRQSKRLLATLAVAATIGLLGAVRARLSIACPFCAASGQTLSQEMESANAVVLARIPIQPGGQAVEKQDAAAENSALENSADADDSTATASSLTGDAAAEDQDPVRKRSFEVIEVLKGSEHVQAGQTIEALFFGELAPEATYFLTGITIPALEWATPIALTPRAKAYIQKLPQLPPQGKDRLAFFQEHLMDQETLLAQDSYDEFAAAPYEAVQELRDNMDREQLLAWLKQDDLSPSRRRLFLTMLGVCGGPQDVPFLEEMLTSEKREYRNGLDALIACYLTLKGAKGMPLVEDRFLKNKEADYGDTYAAIMALRFHGEEGESIDRPRLLQGLRYMLDRPDLADIVIIDLARWQDWSVLDRLVELFDAADQKSSWIRAPVVNYLLAAQRAEDPSVRERTKTAIAHCKEVDAKAVKQAEMYALFGGLARTKPKSETATAEPGNEQPAAAQASQTQPDDGVSAPEGQPAAGTGSVSQP